MGLKKGKSLSKDEAEILSDFTHHVDLANEALASDDKLNELIELTKKYRDLLQNFD